MLLFCLKQIARFISENRKLCQNAVLPKKNNITITDNNLKLRKGFRENVERSATVYAILRIAVAPGVPIGAIQTLIKAPIGARFEGWAAGRNQRNGRKEKSTSVISLCQAEPTQQSKVIRLARMTETPGGSRKQSIPAEVCNTRYARMPPRRLGDIIIINIRVSEQAQPPPARGPFRLTQSIHPRFRPPKITDSFSKIFWRIFA